MQNTHLQIYRRVTVIAAAAIAIAFASPSMAQDAVQKALEQFFELGLPDTKSAKWVTVRAAVSQAFESMSDDEDASPTAGNAWLLSERDGIVEVLYQSGAILKGSRAAKTSPDRGAKKDGPIIPEITIRPAKLDADLKAFTKALKPQAGRDRYNPDGRNKGAAAGRALLFLAQVQRHGETDFVRETLPVVLAMTPTPVEALNAAVSILADARLAAPREAWFAHGDAAAYSHQIEELAATFTRGWSSRDAAMFLAARLKEQKPAPGASDTDAKQAASLLLSLTPAEARSLPRGNWFLSDGREASEFGGEENGDEHESDAPEKAPPEKPNRVSAFFAKKREAATALGKLIGDQRYLRVQVNTGSNFDSFSYSFGESKSAEQLTKEAYDKLDRPKELGELAISLLEPLLPDSVTENSSNESAKHAAISAWIKSAASQSDEQLAWDYLRSSDNTYDNEFQQGIGFLVANGGPETMTKLREVFFDPAVWNSSSFEEMVPTLEKYLKRAPADAAFEAKLRDTVQRGLAAADEEGGRFNKDDNYKKQIAAQHNAQLKQIDALFKPAAGLLDQLTEIAAMDEKEAIAALRAVSRTISQKPVSELEGPAFIAAARAKSPQLKMEFLQLPLASGLGGRPGAPKTEIPPAPKDQAAIDAALSLMTDESMVSSQWDPTSRQSIGAMTAGIVVAIHSDGKRRDEWQKLGVTLPTLSKTLARSHAEAILKGQPAPSMPSSAGVPPEKTTALIAELASIPPEKISAALAGKSPDEQLAIIAQLNKDPEWPAPLVAAHFTVSQLSNDTPGLLGDPKWNGRRLDETLVSECREAMVKSVLDGKPCQILVAAEAAFAGVSIQIVKPKRTPKVPPQQLEQMGFPGLSGKPVAQGLVGLTVQSATQRSQAYYQFPVWKDEALTREWREKHGKAGPAAESDSPRRIETNPAKFEQTLRDFLSLKADSRSPFRVMIYSGIVSDQKDDGAKENEDEN